MKKKPTIMHRIVIPTPTWEQAMGFYISTLKSTIGTKNEYKVMQNFESEVMRLARAYDGLQKLAKKKGII